MRFFKKVLICFNIALVFLIAAVFLVNLYLNKKNVFKEDTSRLQTQQESIKLSQDDNQYDDTQDITPSTISKDCLPASWSFVWELFKENTPLKAFERAYPINFPASDEYADIQGVTCFRGNNYRDSASYGFADITQQKLEKVWDIKTGHVDEWTGVGWNGQPAIIKWGENEKKIMNLNIDKKTGKDLKEVIYATLDGKIYFLDLEDGKATREPINIGFPIKGSVTVDPRGYPLLYAGQGIDVNGGKKGKIGYRIFNLIDQKLLYFINGMDPLAFRRWGAFDSTSLIDKETDSLIECGENGIFYTARLNTKYDPDKGRISINPELYKYRYRSPKGGTLGIENSVAIYKNLAYFADNSGTLQCVDLNTLNPVWIRDITDDTDSTIVLEDDGDTGISLFTACEVDKQGKDGFSFVRKINALTGSLLWEKAYKCLLHSTNGGALATPVVGKNDISNLIIYNLAKTDDSPAGKLIALDKNTGAEVWVVELDNYSWSSPVDIYTAAGKSYIAVCDSAGTMFLIEGKTGRILDTLSLERNVEGSPAVFDNMIVVGTRGQRIFCIKVK